MFGEDFNLTHCQYIYRSFNYLQIYIYICLSICIFTLASTYLSIYLSINLSIHLYIHLSIYLPCDLSNCVLWSHTLDVDFDFMFVRGLRIMGFRGLGVVQGTGAQRVMCMRGGGWWGGGQRLVDMSPRESSFVLTPSLMLVLKKDFPFLQVMWLYWSSETNKKFCN